METMSSVPLGRPPRFRRLSAVLALLVLSPVCAEYLIGYDSIIGRPRELVSGLLFLAPLYGTVAVLIREVVRRSGRGWPSILLLSGAFGLIQAGVIDQSLFNPHFVSDPFWSQERLPTLVPVAGISVHHLLGFVVGHVIWSFAAPIVVVESCVPRLADRPWLGRGGVTALLVLYVLAFVVFFHEHTRGFLASTAQLGTTAVVAAALAAAALALPRRHEASSGWVPPPWLAGGGAVGVMATHQLAPPGWSGVLADLTVLSLGGGLLLLWSGRAGWDRRHALVVGGAALVVNSVLSFTVEPLGGHTSYAAKYAANATLLAAVIALLASAYRRVSRPGPSTATASTALRPSPAPGPGPSIAKMPPSATDSNDY
ncbi:hypothetical protein [Streptomyces diacarni]|uniref:hypothetical protein n=1 Tax=Streptomyces diacarni TaxID=2800381 RepID=UPI001FE4D500|nr:hypothetical protein [Streptomyces diacarni]